MSSLELHSPLRFYTNLINEIPNLMKLYVVYQFKSPGCNDFILAKRKVVYTQEQMSMHLVTEKVPFTTISIIVAITATFKIYSVSIVIQ